MILYGETGTGKSTLVTVGLSIFGLSKDAMTSGGSTPKSNAKKLIRNYEDIETPVEKVLSLIATLYELKQLENGVHFRIVGNDKTGNGEYHIRFNKKVVLSVINKFYAHDKNKCINESTFNSYAKNHSRYRGNITVRDNNGNSNGDMSIAFNITDLQVYKQFIEGNTL